MRLSLAIACSSSMDICSRFIKVDESLSSCHALFIAKSPLRITIVIVAVTTQ